MSSETRCVIKSQQVYIMQSTTDVYPVIGQINKTQTTLREIGFHNIFYNTLHALRIRLETHVHMCMRYIFIYLFLFRRRESRRALRLLLGIFAIRRCNDKYFTERNIIIV